MTYSPISSSYVPLTISDVRFIFDSRFINGFISDNPGINTAISQWNDLSGFNQHVIQATGSKQPILRENIFGNSPGLESTNAAVTEMKKTSVSSKLTPNAITLVSVFKNTSNVSVQGIVYAQDTPDYRSYYNLIVSGNVWGRAANSSGAGGTANLVRSLNTIYIAITTWDGANVVLDLNGATASVALTTPPVSTVNDLYLFNSNDAGRSFDGQIGFVALYGKVLTTDEKNILKKYLSNIFGVNS